MKTSKIAAFEAFALYLLTGAACLVVGTSMTELTKNYNTTIAAIAGLGSAFAAGRTLTVFITGYLTKKLGVKTVLAAGILFIVTFLIGMPLSNTYVIGLCFSALGGVGMGAQDACCPVILSTVFPKNYSSALSAGQALFGAGCFLPPLLMGIAYMIDVPFYYPYLLIASIGVIMLVLLPFTEIPSVENSAALLEESGYQILIKAQYKVLGYVLLSAVCFSYCGITNVMNLYTSTYAESLGMEAALAVTLLTVFNVGCMVGSLSFIKILNYMEPINVLVMNLSGAIIGLVIYNLVSFTPLLFVLVFIIGGFLGVLFSVLVSLATGLNPKNAAFAGATIAVVASASDSINPLITGNLVTNFGAQTSVVYALGMSIICLFFAILFKKLIARKGK